METFLIVLTAFMLASFSSRVSGAPQTQYQDQYPPQAQQQSNSNGNSGAGPQNFGSVTVGSSSGEQFGIAGASSHVDHPIPQQPQHPETEDTRCKSGEGRDCGGTSGSNLETTCQHQEVSPGNFKFICKEIESDVITLKSEHILWLNGSGSNQVVDIEVPNYKIVELIKAGFKETNGSSTQINVLLKRPNQTVVAEVEQPKPNVIVPSVKLRYEPSVPVKVHFPTDKEYKPLSAPIPLP